MTEEQKDLSHYLNNPDALGDMSDAELEALADSQDAAGEAAAEQKGDTESAATPGDTTGQQETGTPTPDGILARDGKHVIPYARLEAAEQRARDLAKQLEELTTQKAAGEPEGEGEQAATTDGFLSDEELDELEAELPALAKVIRAQQAQIRQMSETVAAIGKDHQTTQEQKADDEAKSWQDTLARNPKAAYLDATLAPEVGQKFIDVTVALYPNWGSMSHDERAAAIVRQYEAVHGEVKVQGIAQTKQPAPQPAGKPNVPVSMSGIPGGSAPAVDEAAAMLSKTGAELTSDFMNMTNEQIEASLARL